MNIIDAFGYGSFHVVVPMKTKFEQISHKIMVKRFLAIKLFECKCVMYCYYGFRMESNFI